MGVKTISITEKKGGLAGALIVREHFELVFISQNGMVQRTNVKGISSYGRASQGVKLMNIREDDQVSAVALVAESSADTEARVQEELDTNGAGPVAEGDADVATDGEVDAPEAVDTPDEVEPDEAEAPADDE
jgi:DNA gyrase subunit A